MNFIKNINFKFVNVNNIISIMVDGLAALWANMAGLAPIYCTKSNATNGSKKYHKTRLTIKRE